MSKSPHAHDDFQAQKHGAGNTGVLEEAEKLCVGVRTTFTGTKHELPNEP